VQRAKAEEVELKCNRVVAAFCALRAPDQVRARERHRVGKLLGHETLAQVLRVQLQDIGEPTVTYVTWVAQIDLREARPADQPQSACFRVGFDE
jgi:hypothetical protein